jgi:hypothetical protein
MVEPWVLYRYQPMGKKRLKCSRDGKNDAQKGGVWGDFVTGMELLWDRKAAAKGAKAG